MYKVNFENLIFTGVYLYMRNDLVRLKFKHNEKD